MKDLAREIVLDVTAEQPLYRQIEDGIERMIRRRGLQAGDRIPSPNAFAKALPVNELTVRRAIRRLVRRNILVARQGRGTFVADGAPINQVLWVCGADYCAGDVTPYLTDHLEACRDECANRGLAIEPTWLSSRHPDAVRALCTPETARLYRGLVFLRCEDRHPLFLYARQNHVPHVYVTASRNWEGRPGTVSGHLNQAVQLGLEHLEARGHQEVTLLCVAGYRQDVEDAVAARGVAVELFELPERSRMSQIESESYRFVRHLIAEDRVRRAVFMMDDIVARGATRAMLEAGAAGNGETDVVVRCGRQEMIPFGLPVTYVVNDTGEEARQAVRILVDQIEQRPGGAGHYVSRYRIESGPPAGGDAELAEQVVFSK